MGNFVARFGDFGNRRGKGIGRVSRYEPGRPYIPFAQHLEQPFGADAAEFAPGNRARRSRMEGADPYRHRVEIENQADRKVLLHDAFPKCPYVDLAIRSSLTSIDAEA